MVMPSLLWLLLFHLDYNDSYMHFCMSASLWHALVQDGNNNRVTIVIGCIQELGTISSWKTEWLT